MGTSLSIVYTVECEYAIWPFVNVTFCIDVDMSNTAIFLIFLFICLLRDFIWI